MADSRTQAPKTPVNWDMVFGMLQFLVQDSKERLARANNLQRRGRRLPPPSGVRLRRVK